MRLHHVTSDAPLAATAREVVLSARALAKSYGATRAVIDANLELRAGSIVGMVGENGSGKSTLVKLLSGVTRPDRGAISIGGVAASGFRNPAQASAAGIATVFQEILVAPARSVYDNVSLGLDRLLRFREPELARRRRVEGILDDLARREIHLDAPVEALGIAERQIVTIARALIRRPKVLILDESTSSLDVNDRDRLFDRCRALRAEGLAILFITHRLEELLALTDEIVVIRDGETVSPPAGGVTREGILAAMTRIGEGAPAGLTGARERSSSHARTVLQAQQLVVHGGLPIDYDVRAGTIVGLAGLEGHGQEQFLAALSGALPADSGQVLRCTPHGADPVTDLHSAARHGIVYLPRDRARAGIMPALSVLDNFALPTLERSTRFGLLSVLSMRRRLDEMRDMLHIRAASSRTPITSLSGGNQQKVLIARCLAARPDVLLLDDPTRGVDLPTKAELHVLLRAQADAGLAVVMVSTELEELECVCDEVVVFHENAISGVLAGERITREAILAAMFRGER
jgi:ABC-type sugar transport system ATPase subunit